MDYSIIIPYYNGESTIKRCLESIFSNTISELDFEVLIIDDASIIPAESYLRELISQHNNIHIIRHEKNICQGGGKNTGIRHSKGDYIVFADQDDYIIPDNFNTAITVALQTKPDILSCKYTIVNEDGTVSLKGLDFPDRLSIDGISYCENYFDVGQSLAPWSYIYRRDYLLSISHPFEENTLMEDADWVAWHLIFAKRIEFLPIPIYSWVMSSSSITHSSSWRHKADYVKLGYRKIRDAKQYSSHSASFARLMIEDGKYNIEHTFKKIWKVDKYGLFFQHIGQKILLSLRKMTWSKKTTFMLHYPKATVCVLSLIGPLFRVAYRFHSKTR